MALVTFQVLEGLERGRVYAALPTPLTIGREEDNAIQLNDERVSRFHTKIQEDGDRVILTDLISTNGTRVNGHPVQMRVLQIGDQVSIGRCLLLYGSHDEISWRVQQMNQEQQRTEANKNQTMVSPEGTLDAPIDMNVEDIASAFLTDVDNGLQALFPGGPPGPPDGLRPLQKAQVSDILAYLHNQIRSVLECACEEQQKDGSQMMCIDWPTWQRLMKLEMNLAIYMRKTAEPDD